MIQQIIHVYFMPGMAASPEIFEYIKLPEDQFEIHLLEWIMPYENETISNYALRLSESITHDDIVLLGVSFGGVVVQEISKIIKVRKLIIISSIKSKFELPKAMAIAKTTGAYKIVPTGLLRKIDFFEKYAYSRNIQKRLELYKKYLSVNDSKYLNWALKEMVCWNQETYNPDIIHIHGDNDPVFPIKYILDCIIVPKGTHVMIRNKYKWFNANLPRIILAE